MSDTEITKASSNRNGWQEWSKYVLKELESINNRLDKLDRKLDEGLRAMPCRSDDTDKNPLMKLALLEAKIKTNESSNKKWAGGLAAAVATLLTVLAEVARRIHGG